MKTIDLNQLLNHFADSQKYIQMLIKKWHLQLACFVIQQFKGIQFIIT